MDASQFTDSFENAIRFYNAGNYPQAAAHFSLAIQANPHSAAAWFGLGTVLQDPEKKAYCFAKAKTLDPAISLVALSLTPTMSAPPRTEPGLPSASPIPPANTASAQPLPVTNANKQKDTGSGERRHLLPGYFIIGLLFGLALVSLPVFYITLTGQTGLILPALRSATPAFVPPVFDTEVPVGTPFSFAPYSTPSPTPTFNGTEITDDARVKLSEAKNDIDNDDYLDAIPILDQLTNEQPDFAQAQYYRGVAYWNIVDTLRSESEYFDYLTTAQESLDRAIALDPNQGDYYIYRGLTYWSYADVLPFASQRAPLYTAALQNLKLGSAIGTSMHYNDLNISSMEIKTGQCEFALDRLLNLVEVAKNDTSMLSKIYKNLSVASQCMGDYHMALTYAENDPLIKKCNACTEALPLYLLGRKEDALQMVNQSIQTKSSFSGDRYFLRALIEYEKGEYDLASQDLATGAGNTWNRSEIYYYVSAMIKLNEGDTAEARTLLQFADAAWYVGGPPLYKQMIEDEMNALSVPPLADDALPQTNTLGITPIPVTELAYLTATPLPSPTPTATATRTPYPTSTPFARITPTDIDQALTMSAENGVNNITIQPNNTITFHLVPAKPITIAQAHTLSLEMKPRDIYGVSIKVRIWSFTDGWIPINPKNDVLLLEDTAPFFGETGDIYFSMQNVSSAPVHIEQAKFTAILEAPDGSVIFYGNGD